MSTLKNMSGPTEAEVQSGMEFADAAHCLAHHWGRLDLDAGKEARVLAISRSSEPLRSLLSPGITSRS